MDSNNTVENVIEFLKDSDTVTVTFSQRRFISKIKRLANEHPEDVKIVAENNDGSIVAHVPVKYIKVSAPRRVNMTPEQKAALSERLASFRNADSV